MTPGRFCPASLWISRTLSLQPLFLPLPAVHADRIASSFGPDSIFQLALHQIEQLVAKPLHLAPQVDHAETFILLSQLFFGRRTELPGDKQPLVRRQGGLILTLNLAPNALFRLQLQNWLEEVLILPQASIQGVQH